LFDLGRLSSFSFLKEKYIIILSYNKNTKKQRILPLIEEIKVPIFLIGGKKDLEDEKQIQKDIVFKKA